ncbi:MAG: TolC family protein [Thermodesulfobacteriota bacterium]
MKGLLFSLFLVVTLLIPGQAPATSTGTGGAITLDQAVDAVMDRNPSLAVTWQEIRARRAAARQAGLAPNPTLFGEMEEFGGSGEYAGTGSLTTRLGISQEIPLGGRIGKRVREAEASVTVADLEHRLRLAEIKALAETRFYETFTLQERLKLLVEQTGLVEKGHEVVSKRVRIGEAPPLDLTRSGIELASARIEAEQARRQLDSARFTLAETWGAKVPDFSSLAGDYRQHALLSDAEAALRLEQSPAALLLKAERDRSEAALETARTLAFADLELEGGLQRFRASDDHALFLGISIPLPLFDRNQGSIAEAEAATEKARQERSAGMLALHTELRETRQRLTATGQALQSLETTVLPATREAYDAVSKAYMAGEIDILALLDSQRTLVQARLSRLQLLHELETGAIAVARLLGDGLRTPVPADATISVND